jgi:hypothetical protein
MGPEWEWKRVKASDLVPNWQTNPARPKAMRDDAIEHYASQMENGSPPPGPILRKVMVDGEPKYDVADGVQRITALVDYLKVNEFYAYVYETDSENLAATIRMIANVVLQGYPEPVQWTKRQAIQTLVIERGMSLEELAHHSGWKKPDLETLRTVLTWSFALRCAGAPAGAAPSEGLGDGIVLAIARNAKMEDLKLAPKPIAAFCHDLKNGKFTNGSGINSAIPYVVDFFSGIDRKKSAKPRHKQFDRKHQDFRRNKEVATRLEGRRTSRRSAEGQLRHVIKTCVTVTSELASSGAAVPYMEEFFQLWNQVDRNLKSLAKNKPKVSK